MPAIQNDFCTCSIPFSQETTRLDKQLASLLEQLYSFGTEHDAKNTKHTEQLLNITPDTGLFLSILIKAVRARRVLEIGTSNGYSTIWIADALKDIQGKVTTLEVSEKKFSMAKSNLQKSGLGQYIDSQLVDVRTFLKGEKDQSYDLIFLDAERPEYITYWQDIDRVLKVGCLLIVDNALSPKPEELIDFFKLVEESGRYITQTLQIGKGETLALKER
jgi:predicted O-methyltransferase YrrM